MPYEHLLAAVSLVVHIKHYGSWIFQLVTRADSWVQAHSRCGLYFCCGWTFSWSRNAGCTLDAWAQNITMADHQPLVHSPAVSNRIFDLSSAVVDSWKMQHSAHHVCFHIRMHWCDAFIQGNLQVMYFVTWHFTDNIRIVLPHATNCLMAYRFEDAQGWSCLQLLCCSCGVVVGGAVL